MLILVGGGARSGKSRFALDRARACGPRRAFVATGVAVDEEMRARIDHHVREREGGFVTYETPLELVPSLRRIGDEGFDAIVVDCVTTWIANLLVRGDSDQAVVGAIGTLCEAATALRPTLVVVTNEVGMGLVPETELGRRFRDLVGRAHQRLGAIADEIYLGTLGQLLRLRPGPIELVTERCER